MASGKAASIYKETPDSIKIGVGIVALGLAGWGVYSLVTSAEARATRERLKNREKSDCGGVNLSAAAYNIWEACWNYGGGLMEDEETMVAELKRVPKECVQQLALIYNSDFQKNLYEDFRAYVQGGLYEQVRPWLEQ